VKDMAKKAKKRILKKSTPKKAAKVAKKVVKKAVVKKPLVKKASPKVVLPKKTMVGVVTHFYDHISVAVIEVMNEIKVGDTLEFVGHEQIFKQKVVSMQIDHNQIQTAKKKQIIGMKVARPVKDKDLVYKL
jgi:hypothetical protein